MAARATDAYEDAREKVARFLHASSSDEVVFVRGTTEAINLVAQAWGRANVGPGDEILITWLEHHANIVPWQQLCQATGARLRVAPVDDSGQVMLDEYERLLSDRTRIVAFSHVSNALGTITPVQEMTELAHRHGARVLDRRRPSRVAYAGRRATARQRLVRVLRAQGVRTDRDRRPARKAGPVELDASVAGRRQHDPRRHLRTEPLPAGARALRGRHDQHRRRRRARRGARLPAANRNGEHRPP